MVLCGLQKFCESSQASGVHACCQLGSLAQHLTTLAGGGGRGMGVSGEGWGTDSKLKVSAVYFCYWL